MCEKDLTFPQTTSRFLFKGIDVFLWTVLCGVSKEKSSNDLCRNTLVPNIEPSCDMLVAEVAQTTERLWKPELRSLCDGYETHERSV
jgi:hypothetical protein